MIPLLVIMICFYFQLRSIPSVPFGAETEQFATSVSTLHSNLAPCAMPGLAASLLKKLVLGLHAPSSLRMAHASELPALLPYR